MGGVYPEKQQEFIGKLVNYGHYSPFEHVVFTFAVTGVSRSLSHQLVRHRIASYSQRSQRYINEAAFCGGYAPNGGRRSGGAGRVQPDYRADPGGL